MLLVHFVPQVSPETVPSTVFVEDEVASMCLAVGKGSQPVVLSLADILHQVPLLLDLMSPNSPAALLAVMQTHS